MKAEIAIFQEEIKVIQSEAEPMKELLRMKMPEGVTNAWSRAKTFVHAVKEYAQKYIPGTQPATG